MSAQRQSAPASQESATALQVVPVSSQRARDTFIRLPWSIYRDDPNWVPPLLFERRQFLNPKNPYFKHAQFQSWLAYRDSRAVGRISAQIDELHLQRYEDATGFFGMLEAEDDPHIFQALTGTAEDWLRQKGMHRILGPFNLSINQECGLLVDGFDTPPMVMMGHARRYYDRGIEGQGYTQAKDLLAYIIPADFKLTSAMQSIIRKAEKHVKIRNLRKSDFKKDLNIIRDIFEDAWSHNWAFIPFTEEEFDHLGKELKQLVPEEFVAIAEVDQVPAAMIIGFPNINEIIRDLDGRLLPLGWLKLLWRLKVTLPSTARVPLMGICQKYQKTPLGAALALMIIETVRSAGLRRRTKEVELSWILEDNRGMRNMIEALGGTAYKRYRIYSKQL
jgi:GNAT superfamily N-acetyltransferase